MVALNAVRAQHDITDCGRAEQRWRARIQELTAL